MPSKLDNYKRYLEDRVNGAKPHVLPASVLFREIRQKGYQGKLNNSIQDIHTFLNICYIKTNFYFLQMLPFL